jgi:hypothetical protein
MSIIPPPTDTYTDLTTKNYKINCNYLINSINQDLTCKGKIDVTECCKNFINRIYNIPYNLNQCYNINNTYVEFVCNEETAREDSINTIIIFSTMGSIILCICCAYIYVHTDLFNCRNRNSNSNRNEKQYLSVNNNPTYYT